MWSVSELFGALDLVAAWRDFFFEPRPLATLAIVRMGLGVILIVNSLLLWREVGEWLMPDAAYPYPAFLERFGSRRFTLFSWLPPSESSVHFVLALHLLGAVSILVGFLTPLAATIAFLTLVSIHHRNPLIIHSGDCVLRLMIFLLIFSAAGSYASLDAVLFGEKTEAAPWAQRLMQIQLSIVYFRAFYGKLAGFTWREGSAIYYATVLPEHRRLPLPRIFRKGFGMKLLAWSALAIEASLAILIWAPPLRVPLVIIGIVFHLGIELTLNVQLFGWTMMVCLLLFLPPELIGL